MKEYRSHTRLYYKLNSDLRYRDVVAPSRLVLTEERKLLEMKTCSLQSKMSTQDKLFLKKGSTFILSGATTQHKRLPH